MRSVNTVGWLALILAVGSFFGMFYIASWFAAIFALSLLTLSATSAVASVRSPFMQRRLCRN